MPLPCDPASFSEGWQSRVGDLFPEAECGKLSPQSTPGSLIQCRLQILDQLESEIFFPVVMLKHPESGATKTEVVAFRERLDSTDFELANDNPDFSAASERRIFRCGVPMPGHNGDKDHILNTKVYHPDVELKVLQLYEAKGVYYPEQKSLHVFEIDPIKVETLSEDEFKAGKDRFEKVCSEILMNDQLAGKMLLNSMVSEVYLRRDVLCLGKYTLNINAKNASIDEIAGIIANLRCFHPQAVMLELSLDVLNEKSFNPFKNYETEELIHSRLSLPDRTLLIIDETKLTQGKLNQVGTANITSLGKIIQQQKLAFDYQFYQKDFDTNINIVVISQEKSILPNDYTIQLKPAKESGSIDITDLDQADFARWLATARSIEYKVENDETVQEFIVATRKADNRIGIEELHGIMVNARALAQCRGLRQPTNEILEESRSMLKRAADRA